MSAACPDDSTLTGFCTGRLDADHLAVVSEHVDTCASCFRRMAQVARTTCAAAGDDAAAIGQIVSDVPRRIEEYYLVRRIGHGAMGQVFLAVDMRLDRPVAIKLLALVTSEAARARFLVEARAVARLSHANVVTIYRVGEIHQHPYLVYELVRGQSLDHVDKPMPWPRVREIALGLARGLAAAHRAGVLHRDIKPANAMLCEDGGVKLLDFGLAKLGESAEASYSPEVRGASFDDSLLARSPPALSLTATGATMGTPLYMAPEAWLGQVPTTRMEIYSLGAMLWELCTGRALHLGLTMEQVKQSALAPPRPLAQVAPGVDADLAAIIDRCVERDPQARFASAEELCAALEQPGGEATTALASSSPARSVTAPGTGTRPRGVRGALVAATLLLALLAATTFVVLRADRGAGGAARPSPARARSASATTASGASSQPQACSPDHWCWDASKPMHLDRVWARARDDAWATGVLGTLRHWDGWRWSRVDAGTYADLTGVRGLSADDVWVVGDLGTSLHFDGSVWRALPTPTKGLLVDVLPIAHDDVWAVGMDGLILHWDGQAWTLVPSGTVKSIFRLAAAGPKDVWAVGFHGLVLHWDGRAWTIVPSGIDRDLMTGVTVVAPDDVWVSGYGGFVKRLHHGRWEEMNLPLPPEQMAHYCSNGMWASGPDDVWLLTKARKDNDLWHWDGHAWKRSDPGTRYELYALHGSGKDDLWVVSSTDLILHWDGHAWTPQEPLPTYVEHQGVWAAAADDVWSVGFSSENGWGPPRHTHVERFDGSDWRTLATADFGALNSVWGAAADDVWLGGDAGALAHWDGHELRFQRAAVAADVDVQFIHGTAGNDIWAVGTKGTILHFDGSSWSSVASGTSVDLWGVWASTGQAWAVGSKGTILRWQGSGFAPVASGTDKQLNAVWGSSATDVWALGNNGTALRWNGDAWTVYPSDTPEHLLGISGSAPDDVWAVSYIFESARSTLVHWNGSFWSTLGRTPRILFRGVWSVGHDDVWAVGANDTKARYQPLAH